jgi:hypothetical protein
VSLRLLCLFALLACLPSDCCLGGRLWQLRNRPHFNKAEYLLCRLCAGYAAPTPTLQLQPHICCVLRLLVMARGLLAAQSVHLQQPGLQQQAGSWISSGAVSRRHQPLDAQQACLQAVWRCSARQLLASRTHARVLRLLCAPAPLRGCTLALMPPPAAICLQPALMEGHEP